MIIYTDHPIYSNHSCSHFDFSSTFLIWFSHLYFMLHKRVLRFLNSVLLSHVSNFLHASASFLFATCCSGPPISNFAFFTSSHKCVSLSLSPHQKHLRLSIPRRRSAQFPYFQSQPCCIANFLRCAARDVHLFSPGI